jgi:hypothetical protein
MVTPAGTSFENGFSMVFHIYQNKTSVFLVSLMRATSDPLPTTNTLTLSAKKNLLATLLMSTVTAFIFLI